MYRRPDQRGLRVFNGHTDLPEGGKARRVYLLLRDEMAAGLHRPAGSLPSEQRLAQQFGVSRVTIRRALDALAADGWSNAAPGRAPSCATAAPPVACRWISPPCCRNWSTWAERTTARLLSFSYGAAPQRVVEAMSLPAGARVQTAVRVRLIDETPFSHLTTYVPEEIAAGYTEADLATTPLFRLLERSGVQVRDARQSVSAALASPDVAEALGVSVGSALLSLRRVVRDAEGRGVEYLSALYRSDLFHLEMSMTRVGDADSRHWQPVIADSAGASAPPGSPDEEGGR